MRGNDGWQLANLLVAGATSNVIPTTLRIQSRLRGRGLQTEIPAPLGQNAGMTVVGGGLDHGDGHQARCVGDEAACLCA